MYDMPKAMRCSIWAKDGWLTRRSSEPRPTIHEFRRRFFCHFLIKEGWKNLKCWKVMSTCMASIAIHIEVTTTLATDGFINALRSFIAIRGNVHHLCLDRDTNFFGASNELTEAFKEMSDVEIQKHLLKHNCEFKCNPPNASHMGGVWEIQIRTARRILTSVLYRTSTQLDDDCLWTLFTETTSIMNSKPLTVSIIIPHYKPPAHNSCCATTRIVCASRHIQQEEMATSPVARKPVLKSPEERILANFATASEVDRSAMKHDSWWHCYHQGRSGAPRALETRKGWRVSSKCRSNH